MAEAAPAAEKPKSRLDAALARLSNGFVLLLLGTLITSVLVPHFQREYEARAQRKKLMQDCLVEFLLYSNSIWQEYYGMLPLTQYTSLSRDEYLKFLARMTQIKLTRYQSYAKVGALALAFREPGSQDASRVEAALADYAVHLNSASTQMDRWLTGLYCTPAGGRASPCEKFDLRFDAFTHYEQIQARVVQLGNKETDDVAALMVERLAQR